MEVTCNQCHEVLTTVDPSLHVGAQIQNKGFIYKNPFLFTGKNDPLYFCDDNCQEEYYNEHVPKDEAISKAIRELKKDIPVMVKQTMEATHHFAQHLQRLKFNK